MQHDAASFKLVVLSIACWRAAEFGLKSELGIRYDFERKNPRLILISEIGWGFITFYAFIRFCTYLEPIVLTACSVSTMDIGISEQAESI
jgi:hypothetical protein